MNLPLSQMSLPEKLRVMEELWDDLCRDEAQVPSPDWHGVVLADREGRITRGEATFSGWDEAKRRIRDETET